MTTDAASSTSERQDLLRALGKQRGFLRQTVNGLDDEQAGRRTTVSELCLGGLIKHVSLVEQGWSRFIVDGPSAIGAADQDAAKDHAAGFRMTEGDTLVALLANYDEVAARTDALVQSLPSLDASQPLPQAPWFEQGASWSARTVILHIVAETAHHSGHADIIREALDGAKTMG